MCCKRRSLPSTVNLPENVLLPLNGAWIALARWDFQSNNQVLDILIDLRVQLYNPGAGEMLNNFKVHLKNCHHRACVISRITGVPPPLTPIAPTATATILPGPPTSAAPAAPPAQAPSTLAQPMRCPVS